MAEKYWKSQKSADLIELNKKNLEGMVSFLNAHIESMGENSLVDLIHNLALFQRYGTTGFQLLDFTQHYNRLAGGLASGFSQEAILERKEFFTQVQAHLRSRMDMIIAAAKSENRAPLFQIPGIQKISVYSPALFQKELDLGKDLKDPLEDEKRRVDLRLVDLIWDLDLKPGRFRRCAKCRKYFYQPTSRERNYCSTRCAVAVRQAEFQKRKKREGKGRKK
jgi:hypothetical protein